MLDALAAHIRQFGTGADGLIFTDANGRPIRRDCLSAVWRRAATIAKVDGRSPHDLRHFAASVMIDQGASVKAVQRQLGHGKATTTLDTYAHLWPDSEDTTRRALGAGLAQVVSFSCPGGLAQALQHAVLPLSGGLHVVEREQHPAPSLPAAIARNRP